MSGVDLIKAGFGAVSDPEARKAADEGERTAVYFKENFTLHRDDGSVQSFVKGLNPEVLVSDLGHWFTKLFVTEPPAAPVPAGAAPEPRSNVVLSTGEGVAPQGVQVAAGQAGLGAANGTETQADLNAAALQQASVAAQAAAAAQNPPAPPGPEAPAAPEAPLAP